MNIFKRFKLSDYIFLTIFIVLIGIKLPSIIQNYKREGNSVSNFTLHLLDNKTINLNNISGPKIMVFWATWCPPCKIEIKRYDDAISSGELPKDKIYFVNLNESRQTIRNFLKENKYDFNVALDINGTLSRSFHIKGTPTVVHLDKNNTICNVSVGISPLAIYRAKRLFD